MPRLIVQCVHPYEFFTSTTPETQIGDIGLKDWTTRHLELPTCGIHRQWCDMSLVTPRRGVLLVKRASSLTLFVTETS